MQQVRQQIACQHHSSHKKHLNQKGKVGKGGKRNEKNPPLFQIFLRRSKVVAQTIALYRRRERVNKADQRQYSEHPPKDAPTPILRQRYPLKIYFISEKQSGKNNHKGNHNSPVQRPENTKKKNSHPQNKKTNQTNKRNRELPFQLGIFCDQLDEKSARAVCGNKQNQTRPKMRKVYQNMSEINPAHLGAKTLKMAHKPQRKAPIIKTNKTKRPDDCEN